MLVLCEAVGGRLLQWNSGISQVGTEFQMDVLTQEDIPLGEVGDNLFRSIDVSMKHTGAFVVGITPIIDGVELAEQQFSDAGTGISVCQAFIAQRGARIAARLRTISRSGDIELENISHASVPIRTNP
jgi:hypothetical protein